MRSIFHLPIIRSLFGKILASHLLTILIITLTISFVLSHLVEDYLIDSKKLELNREAISAAKLIEPAIDSDELPTLLKNLGELSGTRIWIMNKNLEIIGDSPPPWRRRLRDTAQNNGENSAPYNQHGSGMHGPMHNQMVQRYQADCSMAAPIFEGENMTWIRRGRTAENDPSITAAVPFGADNSYALFLYTPIFGVTKTANAIQTLLLYTLLGAIIFAALSALLLSRSLTRPISNISEAAVRFANGDFSSRTTASGSDEIGQLGISFNQMSKALENIEKNRRSFFSNVTHELKTPIASIQALTESMLDGIVTEPEKRDRYLVTIINETNHMNRLISDLLHLEQLESGQFSFYWKTINPAEFNTRLLEKFQPLCKVKNIELRSTAVGEITPLYTDSERLEQIITNLISNAIRHSPPDSIIQLDWLYESDRLLINVTDHGEGISAEHLPHIWERFYRVDKARSRADGGTGLGLSITKELVIGLHGTIDVNSIPGHTTCFSMAFPYKNTQISKEK